MGYEEFLYSYLSRGKSWEQLPVALQVRLASTGQSITVPASTERKSAQSTHHCATRHTRAPVGIGSRRACKPAGSSILEVCTVCVITVSVITHRASLRQKSTRSECVITGWPGVWSGPAALPSPPVGRQSTMTT